MTEQEYICRAESLKGQLYRTGETIELEICPPPIRVLLKGD